MILSKHVCLASLADETPEGKSIVELARQKEFMQNVDIEDATFIKFTAETRSSGVNLPDGRQDPQRCL